MTFVSISEGVVAVVGPISDEDNPVVEGLFKDVLFSVDHK